MIIEWISTIMFAPLYSMMKGKKWTPPIILCKELNKMYLILVKPLFPESDKYQVFPGKKLSFCKNN